MPVASPDYTDCLTVCHVATGAHPDEVTSLAALEAQDCRFRLLRVRGIAPMDAAFQAMLDRCETPFLVQVDDDMVLRPDAIRRMLAAMDAAPPQIAFLSFPLHDAHLGVSIDGCKIYRHDICCQYPYRSSYSCEMDQARRMVADGHRWESRWQGFDPERNPDLVGQHGVSWTAPLAFWRYYRLTVKHRRYPWIGWWAPWPGRLLRRLLDGSEAVADLWGWIGAVLALAIPDLAVVGQDEHDYRRAESEWPYDDVRATGQAVRQALEGGAFGAGAAARLLCDAAGLQGVAWAPLAASLGILPAQAGSAAASPRPAAHADERTSTAEPGAPMEPPGPIELNVHLTQQCNLACRWCRRQGAGVPDHESQAHPEVLEGVLARWPSIRQACVAGHGEPLTSDLCRHTVEWLRSRGLYVGLVTNGVLLRPNVVWIAGSGLGYVQVSLNASSRSEYRALTGRDVYHDVLAGIRALAEAGLPPLVSFVVTSRTLEHIPAYVRTAMDAGAKGVALLNLLPHHRDTDRDRTHWGRRVIWRGSPAARLLDAWRGEPWARHVRFWPVPVGWLDKEPPPRMCRSPWEQVSVDGMGFLSGCRRVEPPGPRWGHYTRADAWTSIPMETLRRSCSGDGELLDSCARCFATWGRPDAG